MTSLVVLILATLGGWDIARRLVPWRLPAVAGKVACFVIAYALITEAPGPIVQGLAVVGGIMVIAPLLKPDPVVPWANRLSGYLADRRAVRSRPKEARQQDTIGHRVPKL